VRREELNNLEIDEESKKYYNSLSDEELKGITIEMIETLLEDDSPLLPTSKLFSAHTIFGYDYDANSSIAELISELRQCKTKEEQLNYLKDCLNYLEGDIRKDHNPYYTIDNVHLNILSIAAEEDYRMQEQFIIRAAGGEVVCMANEKEDGAWIDYVNYEFELQQYPNHLYELVFRSLNNVNQLDQHSFTKEYIEKCKQFTPIKNWLIQQIEEISTIPIGIEKDMNLYSFKVKDNNLMYLSKLFDYLIKESIIATETSYHELLLCFLALPIHYIKKPVIWLNSDVQLIRIITDLSTMGIIISNTKFNSILENCFESKHRGGKIKNVKQKKWSILNENQPDFKNEHENYQLTDIMNIMKGE